MSHQSLSDALQAPSYLFISMDDGGIGHPETCVGNGAVVDAVKRCVWGGSPVTDEDDLAQAAGIAEVLIDDGIYRFEGDPPLHLFKVPALASTSTSIPAVDARVGEREAFEAHWYDAYHAGHIKPLSDGRYFRDDVNRAWDAWQARAALSHQPEPKAEPVPEGLLPCAHCGGTADFTVEQRAEHPDFGGQSVMCFTFGSGIGYVFACGDDP